MSNTVAGISGFPEWLPEDQKIFDHVLGLIRARFALCGFEAMETPAVERLETLLAKGADHEIYGLYRVNAGDNEDAKKNLGLRFDLTVPLSRYVAQHYGQITFPYRRYQIAPVWRGERPQMGRYRQFYQCDIDVLSDGDDLSVVYDAEVLSIMSDILSLLNLSDHTIQLNNAKLLKSLLDALGAEDANNIITLIDKWDKIGEEGFVQRIGGLGLKAESVDRLVTILRLELSAEELGVYRELLPNSPGSEAGMQELEMMVRYLDLFSIPKARLKIKPSLARGLNYYTGNIFEVALDGYKSLGSVCGGGKYQDLVSTFGKHRVGGVGASLGLSRLAKLAMEEDLLGLRAGSNKAVLITVQEPELTKEYIDLHRRIRDVGIVSELYLGAKPLAAQMKYAHKKRFGYVIIISRENSTIKRFAVRNMASGVQAEVDLYDTAKLINFINGD